MNESLLPAEVLANASSPANRQYTVVARRYRPKDFSELVGQPTIVQALTTAIQSHRVGHAYLFTGARGVGKTSSARIFAKALNASPDGSGHFDPLSDVAQAIDAGEDMDVLEIDGASNRGIDEIRQLRANVAVRPSRSPYKIYIIDEVHMLTTAAFNALLKTLEEPPPHVKFIFCTTDPEKIPITVLSRCQRFDFAPVKSDQILERLQYICRSEGAEAEDDALKLIARRAAGSLRDSQSLLEQILSFSSGKITVETVHSTLGTADESRLAAIASSMMARDSASILAQIDQAIQEGVDAGQLGEQLLGYLRDMMTIGVGGSADLLRTANATRADELRTAAKGWGTMTLLSAIQILDEALVKMRYSVQSRVLLEVAAVQICHLQDLQSLADLVRALQDGKSPPAISSSAELPVHSTNTAIEEKKKVEVESPLDIWLKAVASIGGYASDCAAMVARIEMTSNGNWNAYFPQGCDFAVKACMEATYRVAIEQAIRSATNSSVEIQFHSSNLPPRPSSVVAPPAKPSTSSQPQVMRKYAEIPIVKSLLAAIDGEILRVDQANNGSASHLPAKTESKVVE